jgi:hypothetical protein
MGVLSATGLLTALVSDGGWGDWWSWVGLGVPVAVMAWFAWVPGKPRGRSGYFKPRCRAKLKQRMSAARNQKFMKKCL